MANLTVDTIHDTMPRGTGGRMSFVAADGVTFFAGGLVGTNAAGFLAKWADTAGHKFEGVCLEGAVGDGSTIWARVDVSGLELLNVAVASAVQGSLNSLVHCTTDNAADFSLVAGSNVKAVGRVSKFRSAGYADVLLYTPQEHDALN